MKVNSTFYIRS